MNRVRAGVSRCAQMRAWRTHIRVPRHLLFCAQRIKSSGKSIRRKKERKKERTEMARKASLSLLEAVAMVTEPGSDAESDVDTFYTDEELDYLEDLDPIEDAESEDVPQAPPDSPVPFTSGVSPASSVSTTPATRPEPSTPSTPTISSESRRRGRDGGHGRSRSPLLSTSSPSPHLLTTTPGRPQQARIIWEAVMCALLTNTGEEAVYCMEMQGL
ncbi:uncharacterized protein LOC129411380 isoform X1 [Boleophthalmus pectinirostris]|uniref:uncharacterized protein LOC129411380 isoform X1 n=1 Tax=Boleophthalmus pectinirostris TaxID=150288 RepID=UPI0024328394|nr:uncharacterized protein LOC129411380 isoform X1 [Boleophthalmus pectinirostris]